MNAWNFAEGRVGEGEGALLTLRVPGQGQYAEVYLSKHDLSELTARVSSVRGEPEEDVEQ